MDLGVGLAFRVTLWTAVAFCLVLGPKSGVAEEPVPTISPTDLYEQTKTGAGPLILDVRTPVEFRSGHIPGARNIPHTELASRLEDVRSDQGVVLYCMMGPRARLGEKTLIEAGIPRVLHLDGGLAAWRQSGLPIERSTAE